MKNNRAIAIVGMGAILPDAFTVPAFWENIINKRYSITDVPEDRWSIANYYDPNPSATDKTYTKIGAYVRGYQLDAFKLGLPIPPKVIAMMDFTQQWAIAASSQALLDYGYPKRTLDPERVAVIFGNANAGEGHYLSTLRIHAPDYVDVLKSIPNFQQLSPEIQHSLLDGLVAGIRARIPNITEDTMPGELSNIIAGRVSNVFNFSGPSFITDAACASSLAAIHAAVEGLESGKFDAALTGGIDRSMGPESYIKFCKIGALSADGSHPYSDRANGFVMGEGAVVLLLKRLEDAEKDGDKVYAVIRGIGGSSDGKGKGITAPNPLGQQRAIERAWKDAGISPATAGLIEGHGTSTKVGDVTEVNSLNAVFSPYGLKPGTVALGSVKSNLGHLKSAAGAVGMLKTALALFYHTLPASANFERPNPNIDFANLPFFVNTQTQPWEVNPGDVRRAGVSSFGFGGTNFHVVVEEYRPGMLSETKEIFSIPQPATTNVASNASVVEVMNSTSSSSTVTVSVPDQDLSAIEKHVLTVVSEKTGYPPEMLDLELDLEADLGVDTVKQAELFASIRTHYGIPRREDLRLSDYNTLSKVIGFVRDALSAGEGSPTSDLAQPQVSQSPEMHHSPVVTQSQPAPYQGLLFLSGDTRDQLKKSLSEMIIQVRSGSVPPSVCPTREQVSKSERLAIDYSDPAELIKRCEKALSAMDSDASNAWQALQAQGIYRGTGAHGNVVFMFPGQGSQYVNMLRDLYDTEPVVADTFNEADRVMTPILGRSLTSYIYVEGDEAALAQAEKDLKNTAITQPAMLTANVALLRLMNMYGFEPDMVIGHSLGEYAALVAAGVMTFPEALQVVSARGREMTRIKLDDNGCMAAVSAPLEKVEEVLQSIDGYVVIANINSPLQSVIGGATPAVDASIAKFTEDGFQAVKIPVSHAFHTKIVAPASVPLKDVIAKMNIQSPKRTIIANVTGDLYPTSRDEIIDILAAQVASPVQFVKTMKTLYGMGARVFVEVGPKRVLNSLAADNLKEKSGVALLSTNHPRKGGKASFNEALCGLFAAGIGGTSEIVESLSIEETTTNEVPMQPAPQTYPSDGRVPLTGSVVVIGAGLGLPGKNGHVFDDRNIESILHGEMRIDPISDEIRKTMVEKKVTRLVKSDAGALMQEIDHLDQTLKFAGQRGEFDLIQEFGVPTERVEALDISTQLAIGAGIEALRDAGIPLVMNYKRTSRGTFLPDRWKLPEALQDETGVIFCSAFPGLDQMAQESEHFTEHQVLAAQLDQLQSLMFQLRYSGSSMVITELERRAEEIKEQIAKLDYHFDRRFVFRVLSMGHSQFAEYIGARGPNTAVNAACATTTHGVAVAEDWIRTGRCRRVVVIAGDDVTNENLSQLIGTSMLASGAASIEENLRLAALPFDKRRNGLVMGMGAAALVIESEDAARERGIRGICEIVSSVIFNSAFHGTRLDIKHVSQVMERLVSVAENRFGINRSEIAAKTAFISHETYTPARGGSASAEIHSLRDTFKEDANRVIIANTKGFTGHAMGVGIEDAVAVKILETGIVPPIAYIQDGFEPDPELGDLNLSKGGKYDPQFSLRLGAGFGSQIAMTLYRKVPNEGQRVNSDQHSKWLAAVAGYEHADLEVVQRTLRIKNQGEPAFEPMKSSWTYGYGPTCWANEAGTSVVIAQSSAVKTPSTVSLPIVSAETQVKSEVAEVGTKAKIAQTQDNEEIKTHVLSVVSEKTGYPVEMLDLELDLEADLGIDTVKQAELFAAIRTHYGIPRREDLKLSEYNTLTKVIGFVVENLGQGSAQELIAVTKDQPVGIEGGTSTVVSPVIATDQLLTVIRESTSSVSAPEIQSYVLSEVSEKTGYPVEMLDLELDLEADLGIDTVKQAELFAAIRTHYGIPRREDLKLSEYNTLTKVIGFVVENLGQTSTPLSPAAEEQPKVEETGMGLATTTANVSFLQQEDEVAESSTSAPTSLEIQAHVLSVVSEKTGYPVEMLDLELDLEADLGIDTVKQAELFAAIRTHYGIPRREDLKLSEYNTLTKVIGFVVENLKPIVIPVVESADTKNMEQHTAGGLTSENPASSSILRRVPKPVLRPGLHLCIPTGVEIDSDSRIVIVKDGGKTADSLSKKLKARGAQVLVVEGAEAVQKSVEWTGKGNVQGVYYLPGLESDPDWQKMDQAEWHSSIQNRAEVLFNLMKVLPGKVFLLTATRMGGSLGLRNTSNPMGGTISGFTKALSRERSDVLIKTVDFEAGATPVFAANRLIEETLHDASVTEVGWEGDLRYTAALMDQSVIPDNDQELKAGSVFVISGGTAGIVPPVVTDLVHATKGKFFLLGRTKLLDKNDPQLGRLKTDREGLKKDLAKQLTDYGKKATPVVIEQKVTVLERISATLELMDTVQTAGGEAAYIECDILSANSVQRAMAQIAESASKVDVFIHAAGVEKSRKLDTKTIEELHQVMDVKADGFFNLFHEMEKNNLVPSKVMFFSSVAGRFGNSGQVDYSAANDLLNKISVWLPTQYKGMKAISIDWGAWAEVGMSSRGSIPMLMERAGIEMMQPRDAATFVRNELIAGTNGEVVVSGSLGAMESGKTGNVGLDVARADAALRAGNPDHIMLSHLTNFDVQAGLSLETVLDPNEHPFLRDHALNGIPVLPGVIGIEGFSVAARHIASILASENGGFQVDHLEDIQFLAPFKFYKNMPRHIQWKAQAVREENGLVVYAKLESELERHNGQRERMLHFTGKVYLSQKPVKPEISNQIPVWGEDATVCAEDIYKLYFHGPSFQVLDCVQRSGSVVLGRLAKNFPSATNNGSGAISTPLLVELCFQTAGLWEAGATGIMALPHSIGILTIYPRKVNGEPIFAEVTPFMEDGKVSFNARVVDAKGHLFLELSNYQTAPLPYAAEPGLIEPMKALLRN